MATSRSLGATSSTRLPLIDTEPDVGRSNPAVQRARLPWLGRLAALAERWRVLLHDGAYGADYRRLLCASQSGRTIASYLYTSAGLGESTTDLAWDWQALIKPLRRDICRRLPNLHDGRDGAACHPAATNQNNDQHRWDSS